MIKKMLIRLPVLFLVVFLTMSLLCVAALANNTVGQVNQTDSSVSIQKSTANGTANGDPTFQVSKTSGVNAGEIYLILIQKGAASNGRPIMPNRDNVYYMNCETATGSSISFNAYPRMLDEGDYTVYLSDYTGGNSGAARVAGTFTVTGDAQYYGDLNGDGTVTVGEITEIIVGRSQNTLTDAQRRAGDVNNDGTVTVGEITQIILARSQGRRLERTN